MAGTTKADTPAPRSPLTLDRVLEAAIDVADEGGIDALTMRGVAASLGVEAMSLYHHVTNKEAMLDGVAEQLVAQMHQEASKIPDPLEPGQWKAAMRGRILSARRVLLMHKWAPGVIESRSSPGPQMMRWIDEIVGLLLHGGLSHDLTHHALHALGSRAVGFTQELFTDDDSDASEEQMQQMLSAFPNLAAMLAEVSHGPQDQTLGWCDDQFEFEFALDLLLDGLDGMRRSA